MFLSSLFGRKIPGTGRYADIIDFISVTNMHTLTSPDRLGNEMELLFAELNGRRRHEHKPKIEAAIEMGIYNVRGFMRIKFKQPLQLGEIMPGLERAVAMSHDPQGLIEGRPVLRQHGIVVEAKNLASEQRISEANTYYGHVATKMSFEAT